MANPIGKTRAGSTAGQPIPLRQGVSERVFQALLGDARERRLPRVFARKHPSLARTRAERENPCVDRPRPDRNLPAARAAAPARLLASVVLAAVLSAAPADALCRLGAAAPPRPSSAEGWLARAEPEVRTTLERDKVAFPEPGSLEPCTDLTPALVVFDHPPETVFALLLQTERQAEFLPQVSDLRAVSRNPGPHVDRHEVSILFKRIVYHVEQHWSRAERRIWWQLSPAHDNDIRALEGFWELPPLDGGRTLGVYGSLVDVGPVLPRRMQARLTRNNLQDAIHALRAWVDGQDAADVQRAAAAAGAAE